MASCSISKDSKNATIIIPSSEWGPGGWYFMESKMQWDQVFTAPLAEDPAYKHLVTMMHHLPGTGCKRQFKEYLMATAPPKVGESRGMWLYNFHNSVNGRSHTDVGVGAAGVSIEEAKAMWTPMNPQLMDSTTKLAILKYRATVCVTDHYRGLNLNAWNAVTALNRVLQLDHDPREFTCLACVSARLSLVVVLRVSARPPSYRIMFYSALTDNVTTHDVVLDSFKKTKAPLYELSQAGDYDYIRVVLHGQRAITIHTDTAAVRDVLFSECRDQAKFVIVKQSLVESNLRNASHQPLWELMYCPLSREYTFYHACICANSARVAVPITTQQMYFDDEDMDLIDWYDSGSIQLRHNRSAFTNIQTFTLVDHFLPNLVIFSSSTRSLLLLTFPINDNSHTERIIMQSLDALTRHINRKRPLFRSNENDGGGGDVPCPCAMNTK